MSTPPASSAWASLTARFGSSTTRTAMTLVLRRRARALSEKSDFMNIFREVSHEEKYAILADEAARL
jgi:hypothetical protein